MSPIIKRAQRSSRRARLAMAGVLSIVIAAVLLWPLGASAVVPSGGIATPQLPLTTNVTAGVRASVGCPSAAIGQNLTLPFPDRKVGGSGNTYVGPAKNQASNFSPATLAVWANAHNDPELLTLDSSGEDMVINGDVISRSYLKVSGNRSAYLGATEYSDRGQKAEPAFDMPGANNCFNYEPDRVPRNSPLAPDGFPFAASFDPDGDGNILEHFDRVDLPGTDDDLELAAGVPAGRAQLASTSLVPMWPEPPHSRTRSSVRAGS